VAIVVALAGIATASTYGWFSAQVPSQSAMLTTGTLRLGESAVHTCTVTNLLPGDASTGEGRSKMQCSFTVTYNGTMPAYLGLDVSIAGTKLGTDPNGNVAGSYLYDSSPAGLQLLIRDNQSPQVTYMSGTTLGGSPTSGSSPDSGVLLVSTTPFTNGNSVTFTVDYSLPSTTTNAYQDASSSVTLTADAAQAANNGSTAGCTPGQVCPGITDWS